MAAAWFGGMQVNAVPPTPIPTPYLAPPAPQSPTSPRPPAQPELQVSVLIAMPRPPSPTGPSAVHLTGETHNHPPNRRPEVALGLAVMPWQHAARERAVPAMWSADRAADMLA